MVLTKIKFVDKYSRIKLSFGCNVTEIEVPIGNARY